MLAIIAILFLAMPSLSASIEKEPEFDIRFGHPLFDGDDSLEVSLIERWHLTSHDRATLNLRHTADLFAKDIRIYYPDLVTPGREAVLSPLGAGVNWSKAIWNDRPWRDSRTNRADLNLLPPMMIGKVESKIGGVLDGEIGFGLQRLSPVEASTRQALTSLHHREGFYGFGPVEFTHTRSLTENSRLYLGGYFPSSTGRFPPHSGYHGQTLWSRYKKDWSAENSLSIMAMDGLHHVESPYQATRNDAHRNDLDLNYETGLLTQALVLSLYRSETLYLLDSMHTYGREWGLGIRFGSEYLYGKIRTGNRDGWLGDGHHYTETEFSGTVALKQSLGEINLSGAVGAEGIIPDRLYPVGSLLASLSLKEMTPYFKISQAVDTHSPEQRFARYSSFRMEEPLEPVWALYPNLPIEGNDIPATLIRSAEIGAIIPLSAGEVKGSAFVWHEVNSAGWVVRGDTTIFWSGIKDRSAEGWQGEYKYNRNEWRGTVSAIALYKNNDISTYSVEPPFRCTWEIGRHKSFYNGAFETDILLSGRYYSRFNSISERSGERLGGAFPLDMRFTGRIRRFTFHYGLHNWNSARYSLIPGYKMMHKEEYWGVEWLLIN